MATTETLPGSSPRSAYLPPIVYGGSRSPPSPRIGTAHVLTGVRSPRSPSSPSSPTSPRLFNGTPEMPRSPGCAAGSSPWPARGCRPLDSLAHASISYVARFLSPTTPYSRPCSRQRSRSRGSRSRALAPTLPRRVRTVGRTSTHLTTSRGDKLCGSETGGPLLLGPNSK